MSLAFDDSVMLVQSTLRNRSNRYPQRGVTIEKIYSGTNVLPFGVCSVVEVCGLAALSPEACSPAIYKQNYCLLSIPMGFITFLKSVQAHVYV